MAEPDALFVRRGDLYEPTPLAHGPWAAGFLHGGPVLGLLAHGAERHRPSGDVVAARLTVDLHRPVPMAPLELATRVVREARRIALVDVALRAAGREVARASALFARASDAPAREPFGGATVPPPGPEGLPTTAIVPKGTSPSVPPGFHREAWVRWAGAPDSDAPAAWMRLPMALVADAACTPFERAATLADLGNAIAGVVRRRGPGAHAPYINPDATLYLEREPRSEWIALAPVALSETDGVGLVALALFDEHGAIGRAASTRLHNPVPA
ncbi:MAG: thioesterase family protein [Myxococcota bacterium]